MVIAVDFDGTIVEDAYPNIGRVREYAKEVINNLTDEGHFITIWTCRTGKHLLEAELFLLGEDIRYHKINQHHPKDLLKYGDFGPKIGADVYIDDKCVAGLPSWPEIYQIIKRKNNPFK